MIREAMAEVRAADGFGDRDEDEPAPRGGDAPGASRGA